MKKTLLSLGLAAFALAASAQNSLVLYSGNKTTDFLSGAGYAFGKLTFVDSSFAGSADKALFFTGAAADYIGGYGNASYLTVGQNPISTKFSGDFASTQLGFTYTTQGTEAAIKVQLKNANGVWGYNFDLSAGLANVAAATASISDFKLLVADQPTGAAITETDLLAVDEVQFIVSGKGTAQIVIILDNLVLADASVLGVQDNFITSNKNEVVSVYDIMGKFVATGKLAELNLESGKLYVVKSGNTSRKIVMN